MVGKLLGGGVSERPKEHASKACDGKTVRGFKSLRHRQSFPPVSAGERLYFKLQLRPCTVRRYLACG